jgi:hypothetical protein
VNRSCLTGPLLLVVIGTTSCGPRQPPGQGEPDRPKAAGAVQLDDLSGKVFVTGSEPHTAVTLLPAEGRGVTLVGDLAVELARLSGAEVRVRGAQTGKPPAGGFEVESYDVIKVDGEVPKVGILTAVGGAVTLVGSDTIELSNVPDQLRSQAGAKVWIVGQDQGGKLGVQSYGILRKGNE